MQENGPSVIDGLPPERTVAVRCVPFRSLRGLPRLSHGRRRQVSEARGLDDLPITKNIHASIAGHPVYPDSDVVFCGDCQLLGSNTKTLVVERKGGRRRTYESRNSYPSQRHRTDWSPALAGVLAEGSSYTEYATKMTSDFCYSVVPTRSTLSAPTVADAHAPWRIKARKTLCDALEATLQSSSKRR